MLDEIVERLDKKNDTKPTTIKYCSIELYEVSDSYDSKQVIQNIKTYCMENKTSYVIAYHDLDVFTENAFNSHHELIAHEGDRKKPHYHILLSFPYRMYKSDIALKFGIDERWILKLKKESDFNNMIFYVTHEAYENI